MKKLIMILAIISTPLFAQNVQIGEGSLRNITTGYDNSVFGINTGYRLTTGYRNILFGYKAGSNLTTGNNNIFIGNSISADSVNQANFINIGGVIKGDATGIRLPKLKVGTNGNIIDSIKVVSDSLLIYTGGKKYKAVKS